MQGETTTLSPIIEAMEDDNILTIFVIHTQKIYNKLHNTHKNDEFHVDVELVT